MIKNENLLESMLAMLRNYFLYWKKFDPNYYTAQLNNCELYYIMIRNYMRLMGKKNKIKNNENGAWYMPSICRNLNPKKHVIYIYICYCIAGLNELINRCGYLKGVGVEEKVLRRMVPSCHCRACRLLQARYDTNRMFWRGKNVPSVGAPCSLFLRENKEDGRC
jgi:hypothetical protein